MSPEDVRSQRACGNFFAVLATLSLVLSGIHFYLELWGFALKLLAGALFFGGIARWSLAVEPASQSSPDAGPELAEAGKPVPVGPNPTHHLAAAKELPPSDKTQSYPKD